VNIDRILEEMNRRQVDYLLIGGVNFLLRHKPVLTFDVDLWIDDTAPNRSRCEKALATLNAEWGRTEREWKPVRKLSDGWLSQQQVYCLTSPWGAIDIFRTVPGLDAWTTCRRRAITGATANGTPYVGLCDADMLAAQEALPPNEQRKDRVDHLREALRRQRNK
jgi:hypothetical protein